LFENVFLTAPQSVELLNMPGAFLGPIASFLGMIFNFCFNLVQSITGDTLTLGLAIILITLIVKVLMFPLAIKSQKSMAGMRSVQPELKKIQDKYKGNNDPEAKRKMSTEVSELYRKNNVNPLSGCLPMLVQLPILFALFQVLQRTHIYVTDLGDIYTQIAMYLSALPQDYFTQLGSVLAPTINDLVSSTDTVAYGLANMENFVVILSNIYPDQWNAIREITTQTSIDPQLWATVVNSVEYVPAGLSAANAPDAGWLNSLITQKSNMETFFGINLIRNSGVALPGIIIPILSGITTFFTTKLTSAATVAADEKAQSQQKMMLYVMPAMMVFFAVTLPAGLGLYWTAGNVFQLIQQVILNKYFTKAKPKEA